MHSVDGKGIHVCFFFCVAQAWKYAEARVVSDLGCKATLDDSTRTAKMAVVHSMVYTLELRGGTIVSHTQGLSCRLLAALLDAEQIPLKKNGHQYIYAIPSALNASSLLQ